MSGWNRFINDESGATAIEYALVAGMVSIAIVGALTSTGLGITDLYTRIGQQIATALP